jgi:uncharacterized protein (DUF2141 family)
MTIMRTHTTALLVTTLAFMAPLASLGQTPPVGQKPAQSDAGPKVEPARTTSTISVRIEGLRNDKGTVFVSLFDNKKAFKDGKNAVVSGQARPVGGSCVVVLDKVPAGRYALHFIHDENENKKLDTNFIGIPKEGFGFSKDAMGRFGPPDFEAAVLAIPAGPFQVVMRAKYM